MPRCQSVSLFAAVTNAGLGVFDEYFAIATDTFGSVMIPELALVWRHWDSDDFVADRFLES